MREADEEEIRAILVVEDQFLLAQLMEDEIESMGYRVVGPAGSVSRALELLDEPLTAALLDINLGDELVTPVAKGLMERNIPFAFLSAYADAGMLPDALADRPFFEKPLSGEDLAVALEKLVSLDGS